MGQLSFVVTNKCNIRCRFCASGCGPARSSAHLSAPQMAAIFDQISADGDSLIDLVVFTGGEPLLYADDVVLAASRMSASPRPPAIRVVTNGFWGKSARSADDLTKRLFSSGVRELNISVDDFHQEFVSLSWVRRAVTAAVDQGIRVILAHKTYPGSSSTRSTYEELLGLPIEDISLRRSSEPAGDGVLYTSGPTVPIGRGSSEVEPDTWLPSAYAAGASLRPRFDEECGGGCDLVFSSYIVGPDGYLLPCCGLVGPAATLSTFSVFQEGVCQAMERSCKLTLFNWLALEGPRAMLDAASKLDRDIPEPGRYVQKCQICEELFSNARVRRVLPQLLAEAEPRLCVTRCLLDCRRALSQQRTARASKPSELV